ncbi:hypothetical protein JHK82_031733 [Glycine max]|nr:hypothetical protein JHK85_032394 [Glycine max]KAG4994999.1 hypothetical protein JHK86_031826 [Glycine max]KAG5124996.1 hypothetical protein JHK82_031733 [Glycine max]KAG5146423.1 hypothetical protein JHK84_031966 [Glycine max]
MTSFFNISNPTIVFTVTSVVEKTRQFQVKTMLHEEEGASGGALCGAVCPRVRVHVQPRGNSDVGDSGGHGEVQLEGDVGRHGEEGNQRGFQSYVAQHPRHPGNHKMYMCLLGGFLADSFLGRYKTIGIFASIQRLVQFEGSKELWTFCYPLSFQWSIIQYEASV